MNVAEKTLDKEISILVSNIVNWGIDTIRVEMKQGGRCG
jgi:hypothetical protein